MIKSLFSEKKAVFSRIHPSKSLKDVVECYWIVRNEDTTSIEQKIIPDGFTEIIFHFGDSYKIKLHNSWELQSPDLLAGQISRFFYLQNTGRSHILGIKFKPTALTRLFEISMVEFTDRVVSLEEFAGQPLKELQRSVKPGQDDEERIACIESLLMSLVPDDVNKLPVERAVNLILSQMGSVSVADVCDIVGVNERQLERLFKHYVGLSPKYFARVIRFSNIFELVKGEKMSGSKIGVDAGFYDQSHFIRNFKAFTGEDPSAYYFNEMTLANFFLKKE